ncbi:MAG: efflux RND transporter periplasmic adaptor subunit [Treponema sp.]|jgi:multidrug efflux pump subunit AcrA (membrane-fusion protein)|nr:efflux RND transporter periplasmic adaptor subunit [Treponema sp.]
MRGKVFFRAGGFIILALIAGAGFSSCDRIKAFQERLTSKGAPPAAPPVPVFAVNTTSPAQGQIRDYLALSGDIVAGSTVDTYSEAAGKITRLYVGAGSVVRKGDPIALVDPSRPGMNYVESVVRAPIGGTVVSLPAQLGMTISQQVSLAKIAGGGGLEIKLYVAERFISRIRLRQPCEITLDAWPGEIFRGTVHEIAPTVDPASRTMEVRVNVDNRDAKLKAGMFAKVRLITEIKENIVKIPANALVERFGESFVFVVEANYDSGEGFVARRRNVSPGILIDGVLEITEGLSPADEIIVRGQTLLQDGARVNIIERQPPLAAASPGSAN